MAAGRSCGEGRDEDRRAPWVRSRSISERGTRTKGCARAPRADSPPPRTKPQSARRRRPTMGTRCSQNAVNDPETDLDGVAKFCGLDPAAMTKSACAQAVKTNDFMVIGKTLPGRDAGDRQERVRGALLHFDGGQPVRGVLPELRRRRYERRSERPLIPAAVSGRGPPRRAHAFARRSIPQSRSVVSRRHRRPGRLGKKCRSSAPTRFADQDDDRARSGRARLGSGADRRRQRAGRGGDRLLGPLACGGVAAGR